MNDIALLLCGDRSDGTAKIALDQLARSIRVFSTRAVDFWAQDITNEDVENETINFGPFCARVILENGCAALMGRLDSFRMLYLSEFQNQAEYDTGKRAKSAFAWSGDVIPEEKSQTLWSIDNDLTKISRALFSKHFDHIFWRPALYRMLDHLATLESDALLEDIKDIDPDNFINTIRGQGSRLYSSLSKGVHWEFFTSALMFDEMTVKNYIRDTFLIMGSLGLASHFVHTAYASLSPDEAVNCYKAIRRVMP